MDTPQPAFSAAAAAKWGAYKSVKAVSLNVETDINALTDTTKVGGNPVMCDLERTKNFYCDVLGFEIHQNAPWFDEPYRHCNWVWLKRGPAQLMLNTAYEADERPASRDPAQTRAHGDTGFYLGCPDIDDAYQQLKAAGIAAKAAARARRPPRRD